MSRQVLPTAPSPTTTHLMVCIAVFYSLPYSFKICKRNRKTHAWPISHSSTLGWNYYYDK